MRRIVLLLAAGAALAGCGGGEADLRTATLALDFQPNPVHSGIYAAAREGLDERNGIDLRIRAPSASTDSLKLLAADRADVVLGSRFLSPGGRTPAGRKLLLKLALAFTRLTTGLRVTDTHNGLRAFSRAAAARLRITQDRMAHGSEILESIARSRLRYVEVPVTVRYSEYSLAKGQRWYHAGRILWDVLVAGWR